MKYKQFKAWLLEGIFDDLSSIGKRGAEIEAERVKNMGFSPRQYQAKPLSINKSVDKEVRLPDPGPPAKGKGLSPLPQHRAGLAGVFSGLRSINDSDSNESRISRAIYAGNGNQHKIGTAKDGTELYHLLGNTYYVENRYDSNSIGIIPNHLVTVDQWDTWFDW